MLNNIDAGVLNITYAEYGAAAGWPCILLHGFPYDIHAFDEVAPLLTAQGARVITPYLRGFGPTRFLSPATLRSGQQAAIGADLRALLDALGIGQALLAGYDWGGRAACIAAALWPERVSGLVSVNGYTIQNIAKAAAPEAPETEMRLWYQYYFQSERGRAGLAQNRGSLARLLWQLWSPLWKFDDSIFARSAEAFDNPDFVEVAIHSYRHRHANAPGDPCYAALEKALAAQPAITIPAITLDGTADGVSAQSSAQHAPHFTARYENRAVEGAGHNLPQEAPLAFADAILTIRGWGAG